MQGKKLAHAEIICIPYPLSEINHNEKNTFSFNLSNKIKSSFNDCTDLNDYVTLIYQKGKPDSA
jgi:hypothetical protein